MGKILNYNGFASLFEGGAAVKSSRRILEREAPATIESIKQILLPLLGDGEMDKDYLLIGSIGKKKDPNDTSGDIDLGVDQSFIARSLGADPNNVLETIEDILEQNLPALLGFTPEMKMMKGINVLSLGWPIEGNADKGIVQLDIIPLSNMDWAKFIFYSPDYRYNESRYKSAHRNWLIQAILSALKEIESTDENGNIQDFYSYALRLSDGIYKNKKTFKGVTKRLKNPETVKGSTEFITREPQEVIGMVFGPGIKENDIRTFEKAWKVVTSPSYIYSDKVEEIKDNLIKYLQRGGFEIPTELI
jgi:hypothetical protein